MLFNIFIIHLFLIDLESDIYNFTNDSKIFTTGNDLEELIIKFENDLYTTLKLFSENEMVAIPEEYQLMFLGTDSHTVRSNSRFQTEI